MWQNTKITDLLGIGYPIMQGPFGGNLSSVELVAAVSNAGGLGGYGAYTLSPQEIVELNNKIKAATDVDHPVYKRRMPAYNQWLYKHYKFL
ncbi:MAG: hypothetical protein EOP49_47700 [Sphingobacteriales bacterium]|nr:MAG: hypothetical protein EOP49_47700 [Sphingobacteriales bacterium]